MNKFFTSESVTEGHPDKICDRISDAVLDAIIENDPNARVACECCTATGLVLIMGEITTESYVDIQKIAKDEIREINDKNIAKDLLDAGYIEAVKSPRKNYSKKLKE